MNQDMPEGQSDRDIWNDRFGRMAENGAVISSQLDLAQTLFPELVSSYALIVSFMGQEMAIGNPDPGVKDFLDVFCRGTGKQAKLMCACWKGNPAACNALEPWGEITPPPRPKTYAEMSCRELHEARKGANLVEDMTILFYLRLNECPIAVMPMDPPFKP